MSANSLRPQVAPKLRVGHVVKPEPVLAQRVGLAMVIRSTRMELGEMLESQPALERDIDAENLREERRQGTADPDAQGRHDHLMDGLTREASLSDYLRINFAPDLVDLNEQKAFAVILEYLDESNGFLTEDVSTIAEENSLDRATLDTVRGKLLEVDPLGIGTLSQLDYRLYLVERADRADSLDANVLRLLLAGRATSRVQLLDKLDIEEETLEAALDAIADLPSCPWTGEALAAEDAELLVPELIADKENDLWVVKATRDWLPLFRISAVYEEYLAKNPDKETTDHKRIQDNVNRGKGLLDQIELRLSGLEQVGYYLMTWQGEFSDSDGDRSRLKPLSYEDVGKALKRHRSTIWAQCRNTWIKTPFGAFPLKTLVPGKRIMKRPPVEKGQSQPLHGKTILPEQIDGLLERLIAAEDKSNPFRDNVLAVLMNACGVPISRRAVANKTKVNGAKQRRNSRASGQPWKKWSLEDLRGFLTEHEFEFDLYRLEHAQEEMNRELGKASRRAVNAREK